MSYSSQCSLMCRETGCRPRPVREDLRQSNAELSWNALSESRGWYVINSNVSPPFPPPPTEPSRQLRFIPSFCTRDMTG